MTVLKKPRLTAGQLIIQTETLQKTSFHQCVTGTGVRDLKAEFMRG